MKNDTATMEVEGAQRLALKVTPKNNAVGIGSGTDVNQICATVEASGLPDEMKRAPVDIVVGLDVSGSMSGSKLNLCKTTLELLLRQLTAEDRFGLVSFGSDARIEVSIGKVTDSVRERALEKIKSLGTRGCTNMSSAIGLTSQEMGSIQNPNDVRSIFLLTDGLANEGISDRAGLTALTKDCLSRLSANKSPVTLHTFGYGSDHDSALLSELSKITRGGSYYFVETDSSVASAFGNALGGILSVVAQTALIDIRVPADAREAGVKILDVYHDGKVRVDDWHYKVTLGDFYAEESRDALFTIKLSSLEISSSHVDVSLSYLDVIDKELVVTPSCGCYIARPAHSGISDPNESVEVQWLRVTCVQEMAKAEKLSLAGQLKEARGTIDGMRTKLKAKKKLCQTPLVQQLVGDMDGIYSGLESKQAYAQHGAKRLGNKFQSHAMQRCTASRSDEISFDVYTSAKKTAMSSNFMSLSKKK